jgi:hypothetical protein
MHKAQYNIPAISIDMIYYTERGILGHSSEDSCGMHDCNGMWVRWSLPSSNSSGVLHSHNTENKYDRHNLGTDDYIFISYSHRLRIHVHVEGG